MKSKKKIYILHGWTYSTEKWKPFIDELKNRNIRVELLKIPGLTSSLDEVWELGNYVEWLKDILDKDSGKVILLGHSNGGRIALAFSEKYPEKIKKLFLIDSAGIYHNEFSIKLKRIVFGIIERFGKKIIKSFSMKRLLYKFAREDDYVKANPIVRKTMINLLKSDIKEIFLKIKIPTIIIWGEEDKITPISDAKLMNDKIINSKLNIISGARHSPMYTHINEVVEVIVKNL